MNRREPFKAAVALFAGAAGGGMAEAPAKVGAVVYHEYVFDELVPLTHRELRMLEALRKIGGIMNQFETICAHLASLDYFPHCHRRKTDWQCELYTSKLKTVPSGTGVTVLDALLAADAERKRLEKDPRYKAA